MRLSWLPCLALVTAVRMPIQRCRRVICCTEESKLILDPLNLRCCAARLEQHSALELPRLVLRARPASIEESELEQMCLLLRSTLDRQEPFTVLWDLRGMHRPSRAALRFGIDWMGADENAEPIDELVQSTVIIANSPIVRALCGWILKVTAPPRPVQICKDDAAAVEAARSLQTTSVSSSPLGSRSGQPVMSASGPRESPTEPGDEDFELDDLSSLLEAMDIAAQPGMGAAMASEASQLAPDLASAFDVDALKQSLATFKEEAKRAEQTSWKEAFGEKAEVTDAADTDWSDVEDGSSDGFSEFVDY
jgi:hypothetical protein